MPKVRHDKLCPRPERSIQESSSSLHVPGHFRRQRVQIYNVVQAGSEGPRLSWDMCPEPSCGITDKLDEHRRLAKSTLHTAFFSNFFKWSNYLKRIHNSHPHQKAHVFSPTKWQNLFVEWDMIAHSVPSVIAGQWRNVIRDFLCMCCEEKGKKNRIEQFLWKGATMII